MDISVIIVNYNVKYFLEQCLYSTLKACRNISAEIFVVDNNSTDGSREYLPKQFPDVHFRWLEKNAGFAAANNSVLPETTGDYILFLNPDTIIPEDCFEAAIQFFKSHTTAGALGIRMIDGHGKFLRESKRSFPTPLASLFKLTGLSTVFPSSGTFSKYYVGHLPENKSNEVDVLAGAFMMLSRACLQQVKGFDEDYFMYGEDIDLSYRIQQAGFKNYYFAGTSIIHFKGESTSRKSPAYIDLFYGAMKLFVRKHYHGSRAHLPMHAAITAGKMIASAKARITRTASRMPGSVMQVAVIAEQQRFEEMIRLMKHSKRPLIFKGRIAPGSHPKGIHIGVMDDIPMLVKRYDLNELVFCEGELTFKTIIEKIQSLPVKTGFLFHAKGSQSVVGSNNKNEPGFFIAKD